MKIAQYGTDFIELNETNMKKYTHVEKVHLIKLSFNEPTPVLIEEVLKLYPSTNRFIIHNNIKVYNDILKSTTKKYYVENNEHHGFITFFRKNNKVLLNFEKFTDEIKEFLLNNFLFDILKNVEVIIISKKDFMKKEQIFKNWNGNVILK